MTGGSSKVTPILTLKLYKSDRCGFCNIFMPAWKETQTAYEQDSKIKFITLDADEDAELIKSANIEGFPTVHILSHKGDSEEYKGDRTHEGLVTRIEELLKSYKI
jgi:thiol-disulfide isomerase/thioredoxin